MDFQHNVVHCSLLNLLALWELVVILNALGIFKHYIQNCLRWINARRFDWWWVNNGLSNKQLDARHSTKKYGIIMSLWFKENAACTGRTWMANHPQNFWKHWYLKHFLSKCHQMNATHWWKVKIRYQATYSGIMPLPESMQIKFNDTTMGQWIKEKATCHTQAPARQCALQTFVRTCKLPWWGWHQQGWQRINNHNIDATQDQEPTRPLSRSAPDWPYIFLTISSCQTSN